MKLFIVYAIKSILNKKLTTSLTVLGFALVIFIFSAVLMLSNGMNETLIETGQDENIIAIRKGSPTEITSIIYRDMGNALKVDEGVMTGEDGNPIAAGEISILINHSKRDNPEGTSNIPVRGVVENSYTIRPNVKIIKGRKFTPGTSELIAGVKVAGNFNDCDLGEKLNFAMRDWNIVGVFEASGSGSESELWGDYNQICDAFQRPIYSSVTMQMKSPSNFDSMKKRLESDPRFNIQIEREKDFYRKQSNNTRTFINILGVTISIIFSMGAVVGAMITMYAAVANRTVEIGTMRALGFRRKVILASFLFESLLISLAGATIGICAALFLTNFDVSTTNWDTFSELAFSFEISNAIVVNSYIFALVMGVIGGFLPAVRASRLRIINALRAK
jgi:ABC-type antimicrobial peptide transport system permease subunit